MKTDIPQLDWAKLAAYIDGEGCIQIHRQRQYSKKVQPNWRPHYIVQVSVTNTDPRLVVWCRERFGGYIVLKSHEKRQCFGWYVHSARCAWVLENCLPHFVMKKAQAEIAIAFRKTYDRKYIGRGRMVPLDVIAHRDALVSKLKLERDTRPEFVQ